METSTNINGQVDENIMYFDNDDQFTNFCLGSEVLLDHDRKCYDLGYAQGYLDALNAGTRFQIADENSRIKKRGCVTRGLISKPVSNII